MKKQKISFIFLIVFAFFCGNFTIAADISNGASSEQSLSYDGKTYVINASPSIDFVYLQETNSDLFNRIFWTLGGLNFACRGSSVTLPQNTRTIYVDDQLYKLGYQRVKVPADKTIRITGITLEKCARELNGEERRAKLIEKRNAGGYISSDSDDFYIWESIVIKRPQ